MFMEKQNLLVSRILLYLLVIHSGHKCKIHKPVLAEHLTKLANSGIVLLCGIEKGKSASLFCAL